MENKFLNKLFCVIRTLIKIYQLHILATPTIPLPNVTTYTTVYSSQITEDQKTTTLGSRSSNSESNTEYTTNRNQITSSVYPVSISTDPLVEETTTRMSSSSTILYSDGNYITDVTTVKEKNTTSIYDLTTDNYNQIVSRTVSFVSANESGLIGSIEREIVLEVHMNKNIPSTNL